MIDTGLLYAAGRGKRMGALTDDTPKPLLRLNEKALIDYGYDLLLDAKVNNIHVNAAYLAPQIVSHFDGRDVVVHVESDGAYETGGTLKSLATELPDRIFTLNSDVLFFGKNPVQVLQENWRDDLDALLLLMPRENAKNFNGPGDFFWDGERLEWRGEAETAPFIFASAQIIRPKWALDFEETVFSTTKIWDKMMREGHIRAVVYDGGWMDLGNADSLMKAKEELKL